MCLPSEIMKPPQGVVFSWKMGLV